MMKFSSLLFLVVIFTAFALVTAENSKTDQIPKNEDTTENTTTKYPAPTGSTTQEVIFAKPPKWSFLDDLISENEDTIGNATTKYPPINNTRHEVIVGNPRCPKGQRYAKGQCKKVV